MTNTPSTDDRELIERLRERKTAASKYGGFNLVNPYGPEAADRLESLLSDRAKLEEALRTIADHTGRHCVPSSGGRLVDVTHRDLSEIARAALNGGTDHTP